MLFFHILGIVTPTDELIFFRGVEIPPTRLGSNANGWVYGVYIYNMVAISYDISILYCL